MTSLVQPAGGAIAAQGGESNRGAPGLSVSQSAWQPAVAAVPASLQAQQSCWRSEPIARVAPLQPLAAEPSLSLVEPSIVSQSYYLQPGNQLTTSGRAPTALGTGLVSPRGPLQQVNDTPTHSCASQALQPPHFGLPGDNPTANSRVLAAALNGAGSSSIVPGTAALQNLSLQGDFGPLLESMDQELAAMSGALADREALGVALKARMDAARSILLGAGPASPTRLSGNQAPCGLPQATTSAVQHAAALGTQPQAAPYQPPLAASLTESIRSYCAGGVPIAPPSSVCSPAQHATWSSGTRSELLRQTSGVSDNSTAAALQRGSLPASRQQYARMESMTSELPSLYRCA